MNQFEVTARFVVVTLALLALLGCASPSATKQSSPARRDNARDALPCDEALRVQTADAHPDIRWVVGDDVSQEKFVSCLLRWKKDSATLEVAAYLTSDLYKFIGECRESEQPIRRVFEYKDKARPYLLRLHTIRFVDPYTYIVVGSYPNGTSGYYAHSVDQKTNDYDKLKSCRP
jgi:hypothetical protein